MIKMSKKSYDEFEAIVESVIESSIKHFNELKTDESYNKSYTCGFETGVRIGIRRILFELFVNNTNQFEKIEELSSEFAYSVDLVNK